MAAGRIPAHRRTRSSWSIRSTARASSSRAARRVHGQHRALIERGGPCSASSMRRHSTSCTRRSGPTRGRWLPRSPRRQRRTPASPSCSEARCTRASPIRHALLAVASRSHLRQSTERSWPAARLPRSARPAPRSSSACIARGEADLYPRLGETIEWDTAAGHAILAAAGGCVTTPRGSAAALRQGGGATSAIRISLPGARASLCCAARPGAENCRNKAACIAASRPQFGNTLRRMDFASAGDRGTGRGAVHGSTMVQSAHGAASLPDARACLLVLPSPTCSVCPHCAHRRTASAR